MLGEKARHFAEHQSLSLEALVPPGHFYRQLERGLDLAFVRDLVRDCYADRGRPSVDPVVFFKLQLVLFFEGLRSERQLMQVVADRLSLRWYVGYDLGERLPDHSSLTKIRERYGVATFRRFFEVILERCREAGLLWGQELYADATKVQANAAYTSYQPRFAVEAHLQLLFADGTEMPAPPGGEAAAGAPPVAPDPVEPPVLRPTAAADAATLGTANAARFDWLAEHGRPPRDAAVPADRWAADYRVSTTDRDATVLHLKNGGPRLGYQTHYLVDGGKARLIVNVLVAPAEVKENEPFLDLFRQARFRWRLRPRLVAGDSKYGTAEIVAALERQGIRAYMPLPAPNARPGLYPKQAFAYDAAADVYVCPQGTPLARRQAVNAERIVLYQAPAETCNACPCKAGCTDGQGGRQVRRQFEEEYLDRVRAYVGSAPYEKALRKRGVWVEPLFAEAKDWHGLRRFRLRGLEKVNREALLVAAGQNLKRLLSDRGWGRRPWPTGAPGLHLSPAAANLA
jgi:transposase